jgi:hypothetical protein
MFFLFMVLPAWDNTGLCKHPHLVLRINDLMIDLHGER